MVSNWIKLQCTTPDKPEVHQIAELLGIDPDAVVGKLCRIWIWADQQTVNGNAPSVTRACLDRVTNVAGFAQAMETVGWLVSKNGSVEFPNFEAHNGNTAKNRGLSAKRSASRRAKTSRDSHARTVTKRAPSGRGLNTSSTTSTLTSPDAVRGNPEGGSPDLSEHDRPREATKHKAMPQVFRRVEPSTLTDAARLNAWIDWQQREPVPVAVAPTDDERIRILACGLYAARGSPPTEAVETFAAMVERGDKPTAGSFLREARAAFKKLTEAASADG